MVTKTLATIGPITENKRDIYKILTYTKFIRTNSSHNTINWHKKISDTLKSIDRQTIHLLDIPGIKPRTGNKNPILIKKNELIIFYFNKKNIYHLPNKKIKLTKPLPELKIIPKKFTISDGLYKFSIIEFNDNYVIGKSLDAFLLLPHKGFNIEKGKYNEIKQLTHYKKFLEKVKKVKFDAIGLSFVQSKKIIEPIKKIYKNKIIVSKIENFEGFANHKEIINYSDAIMIDRGDLSAEIGIENLFDAIIQISNEVKKQGKPLIMATENLDSMKYRNEPTKSEVMSLNLSALLGADYNMLSDETATYSSWLNTLKWLNNFNKFKENLKYDIRVVSNSKNLNKLITDKKKNNLIKFSGIKNKNYPLVFYSKTGKSIANTITNLKMKEYFVFTDRKKTEKLCMLWSNVTPIYVKNLKDNYLKFIKKNKEKLYKKNYNNKIYIINNLKKIKKNNHIQISKLEDLN